MTVGRLQHEIYCKCKRQIYKKKRMILTYDYPTKKDFKTDLAGNGYIVYFITTEENFDEDCAKYYERYEKQKNIQKLIYDARRKEAKRMNMTVKQYKEWLKG